MSLYDNPDERVKTDRTISRPLPGDEVVPGQHPGQEYLDAAFARDDERKALQAEAEARKAAEQKAADKAKREAEKAAKQ